MPFLSQWHVVGPPAQLVLFVLFFVFRFSFFIFVFIFDLQGERGQPRLSNKQRRGAMEWQTGKLFPFFFFFLFDL
jgi:hypothetical protein